MPRCDPSGMRLYLCREGSLMGIKDGRPRERACIRSEKGIRWGRRLAMAAA